MSDQLAVLCNGWHSGWHQYIMMGLGGVAVSYTIVKFSDQLYIEWWLFN